MMSYAISVPCDKQPPGGTWQEPPDHIFPNGHKPGADWVVMEH